MLVEMAESVNAAALRPTTAAMLDEVKELTDVASSETRFRASNIPPLPQLFGRATELEAIVAAVTPPQSGHVCVLGGPGM